MDEKEKQLALAAAKKKLAEYKAQNRQTGGSRVNNVVPSEMNPLSSNQRELSQSSQSKPDSSKTGSDSAGSSASNIVKAELNIVNGNATEVFHSHEDNGFNSLNNSHSVFLTIDSESEPQPVENRTLPPIPNSIETSEEVGEGSPPSVDDVQSEFTNASPEASPPVKSPIEKTADVLDWVERDTQSKRHSIDMATAPLLPSNYENSNLFQSPNDDVSVYVEENTNEKIEKLESQVLQLKSEIEKFNQKEKTLVEQLEEAEVWIQNSNAEKLELKTKQSELETIRDNFEKVIQENTELKMILSDLRAQLNLAVEDNEKKKKSYDEIQSALIKVSNSKRELESNFDLQEDRIQSLKVMLRDESNRAQELGSRHSELTEKYSKFDSVIHARDEEIKALHDQIVKLKKQIEDLRQENQYKTSEEIRRTEETFQTTNTTEAHPHHHQDMPLPKRMESIEESDEDHKCHDHDHGHNDQHHSHEDHSHHDHDHVDCGGHDHKHDHEHGHDHLIGTPTPMEKKLARLEWENVTYREELDKLANILNTRTADQNSSEVLLKENEKLRSELAKLEIVVGQLEGENESIGDYISLCQTQKLVLKEKFKAKDREMESLARERAELRVKMDELNVLLKGYKESAAEEGKPIEKMERIDRLINTINNSSASFNNFHPCGVCSGTLLNV